MQYTNELYHYGVLGMKWGVRRYQDYGEGGYVPKTKIGKKLKDHRKERKLANTYDYRKSEKYKSGDRSVRRRMSKEHEYTSQKLGLFSSKATRRVDYKVNEKGADRKKETKKEMTKRALGSLAVSSLISNYDGLIATGKAAVHNAKVYTNWNNMAVDSFAKKEGLNYVKKGKTFSFDAIKRGKKVYEYMSRNGRI